MTYVFINPLSNNRKGKEAAAAVKSILKDEKQEVLDICSIKSLCGFIGGLNAQDKVVLCGGDGTLSRFAHEAYGRNFQQEILYYPAGSGNDFAHDVMEDSFPEKKLIPLKEYLKSLPVVTVNGERHYFLNGIGFGIDGYCCEKGDELRAASDDPVNYAGIAIKGLLGKFRPSSAKVTVDGVTKSYKKAWLVPCMVGRYYGGGMKVAPDQDRLSSEKTVSCVVWHDGTKFGTLARFPSVFKGEHVKYTRFIEVISGHEVCVEFDRPQALQIDGETVKNVTSYSVVYR